MSTARSPLRPTAISAVGLSKLGGLLAGLDQLDPILSVPETVDPERPRLAFGRFRLVRRLGAGRFGVVLLADDPDLGRQVVVKVPQPTVLTDPGSRERFVREARSAARLDHPGIVPVFEAGELNGLPYLVAGYVNGATLGEWLRARSEPLPGVDAARLVARLAAAVQHAHDRGVLHCDLSPSNILLAATEPPNPEPVITDFGLARLIEDDPTLTRTYQVAGTPLYMSPEQALGERRGLTAQTDVYALGVILYEFLTGRPPFASGSEDRVVLQVIHTPPEPPRRVNPTVPHDLDAVCLKCLEKNPTSRYRSADSLLDDLDRFLTGRPTAARPVGVFGATWRAMRRRPFTAALIAFALAAVSAVPAIAMWYSVRLDEEAFARREAELRGDRDRDLAQTSEFFATLERVRARRQEQPHGWADETLADIRGLGTLPLATHYLPDLRSEAAAALAAVDLRPVRVLAEGFKAYAVAFSPDGSSVALCGWEAGPDDRGVVRLYDPATGMLRKELTYPIDPEWSHHEKTVDGGRSVAFSPDGKWLVVGTRGGQLARWNLAEPNPRPVVWTAHTDDSPDKRNVWVMALAFTSDGTRLYSSCRGFTRTWDVRDNWSPLGPRHDYVIPSGTPVLANSTHIHVLVGKRWDLARIDAKGEIDSSLGVVGEGVFATSRDGRLMAGSVAPRFAPSLVALGRVAHVWPLGVGDREHPRHIRYIGFNPESTLVTTTEEQERHIQLWDAARGDLVTERVAAGGSLRFAFSPDGRHLAVAEDERTVFYQVTGRVRETLALAGPRDAHTVAVQHDGRTLTVLHSDPMNTAELSTWDVTPDRLPVRLTMCEKSYVPSRTPVADCTPDGTGFAFTVSRAVPEQGVKNTRVEFSDGTSMLADDVTDLRFGPDGRLWAAASHRVCVWTLPGWREECPLENGVDSEADKAGNVFRVVAPGRTVSAVGQRYGQVHLFRSERPAIRRYESGLSGITSIALPPDEDRVFVGGEKGDLSILSVTDGTRTLIPDAHRAAILSVAFGPNGWFATGSSDRTVKLWTAAGQPVLTLRAGGAVRKVAVSSDNTLLTVLVEGERAVRRWRLDLLRSEFAAIGLKLGLP